jgi:hypothetical protein
MMVFIAIEIIAVTALSFAKGVPSRPMPRVTAKVFRDKELVQEPGREGGRRSTII